MDEAETLCDRVAIITGGRLAALGSPAELTRARRRRRDLLRRRRRPRRRRARQGARPRQGHRVGVRPGEYVVRADGTPDAHRRPRVLPPRPRRDAHRRCSRAGARSKPCSCRSPPRPPRPSPSARRAGRSPAARRADETPRARRAVARRAHAAAPPRREPDRDARGTARHPRVLLEGRHDDPDRLQEPGRLPRARRALARGHGRRDGVARDRDRIRAPLRRAEAARLHAAVARRPARGQDRGRAAVRAHLGGAHRRDRHRARLARSGRARSPRSGCCSSARSRSPASAC